MAQYSYVKCKYPLGWVTVQDEEFRCRNLEGFHFHFDHYTVTEEGRLILHEVEEVRIPPEERPYGHEKGPRSLLGSRRLIPKGDRDVLYHGPLVLERDVRQADNTRQQFVFLLVFIAGVVEKVYCLEPYVGFEMGVNYTEEDSVESKTEG